MLPVRRVPVPLVIERVQRLGIGSGRGEHRARLKLKEDLPPNVGQLPILRKAAEKLLPLDQSVARQVGFGRLKNRAERKQARAEWLCGQEPPSLRTFGNFQRERRVFALERRKKPTVVRRIVAG